MAPSVSKGFLRVLISLCNLHYVLGSSLVKGILLFQILEKPLEPGHPHLWGEGSQGTQVLEEVSDYSCAICLCG